MPNVMYPIKFPWGGDVNQAINPWNWALRSDDLQIGFFNVNLGKSSDPEMEHRILDDVGSYGRQLGRMGEVLEVLLDRTKLNGLDADQADAIDAFRCQLAEVRHLKQRYGLARNTKTADGNTSARTPRASSRGA